MILLLVRRLMILLEAHSLFSGLFDDVAVLLFSNRRMVLWACSLAFLDMPANPIAYPRIP
jgi:hypothetical protein